MEHDLPKELSDKLQEYLRVNKEAGILADKAKKLRLEIAKLAFPNPREGSNTLALGNGYKLKVEHKINRRIDVAALTMFKDTFEGADIKVDDLVRYKPELTVGNFKKLSEEKQRIFGQCLTITEGTPTVELVEPKAK